MALRQRNFDGPEHPIDEPRRGLNTSPAIHDVSVAVVGPGRRSPARHAASVLERGGVGRRQDAGADRPGAARGSGEDGVARVQVVLTLSGRRFESLGGTSQKGILEAYLRALSSAKDGGSLTTTGKHLGRSAST